MARVEIQLIGNDPSPRPTEWLSTGTLVLGRGSGRFFGGVEAASLGAMSAKLITFKVDAGTVSVGSDRAGGSEPVLWRRGTNPNHWIPLGVLGLTFNLSDGIYQIVVSSERAKTSVHIAVVVTRSTVNNWTPDITHPRIPMVSISTQYHAVLAIHCLLARVGCRPNSDKDVIQLLRVLYETTDIDYNEPSLNSVRNTKQKIAQILNKDVLDKSQRMQADPYLANPPYQQFHDGLVDASWVPVLTAGLSRVASGSSVAHRLAMPVTI